MRRCLRDVLRRTEELDESETQAEDVVRDVLDFCHDLVVLEFRVLHSVVAIFVSEQDLDWREALPVVAIELERGTLDILYPRWLTVKLANTFINPPHQTHRHFVHHDVNIHLIRCPFRV